MSYCAKSDVELAFGSANVRKWADLENTGLQATIDARIEWAIANADSELDAKLAGSRYQFPLDDDSDLPPILVRMSSYLAGVLLYESRGVTDRGERGEAQHALMWHRKRVDEFIQDVWGKRVDLLDVTLRNGAVTPIDEGPVAIVFDDPSDAESVPWVADNLINTEEGS